MQWQNLSCISGYITYTCANAADNMVQEHKTHSFYTVPLLHNHNLTVK